MQDLNEYKRVKRLEERIKRLEDKRCLNCDILLASTIEPHKRAYKYCRYCIQNGEAGRHKWNRYYKANREALLPKMRKRTILIKYRNFKPTMIESLVISPARVKFLQELSMEEEFKPNKI